METADISIVINRIDVRLVHYLNRESMSTNLLITQLNQMNVEYKSDSNEILQLVHSGQLPNVCVYYFQIDSSKDKLSRREKI